MPRFVSDVVPYETMKLRLLNGSHSALAYLGFLVGYDFIWQAIRSAARRVGRADDGRRGGADAVRAARRRPCRLSRAAARASAIRRCRTARARSRWTARRSCRSGCSPRARAASRGASIARLALAVAAWIRYASGTDEHGKPIVVSDPMAETFAASPGGRAECRAITNGLSRSREVFGDDLPADRGSACGKSGRRSLFRDGVRRRSRSMSLIIDRRIARHGHPLQLCTPTACSLDPATLALARQLYNTVENLPIVSPHGHTDPQWFADDAPFADAAALFITPDHYLFRMLYSQGIRSSTSASRGATAPPWNARAMIWRTFATHYHLFRGTPSRIWLDHAFATVFGCTERLADETADRTSTASTRAWRDRSSGRARCSNASTSR